MPEAGNGLAWASPERDNRATAGRFRALVDPTDEKELVRRFRAGDEEAFRILLERHADALRARASRWLGAGVRRRLSVSDLLQEASLVAFRRRQDFEENGSFRSWLLGIVDLKARAALRRHDGVGMRAAAREVSRGQRPDTAHFAGSGTSPSEHAMRAERREAARRALDALAPGYREVLRLAREEGLTLAEVAERMGRSREAVKKLYARAVVRFKEAFDTLGGEP